MSAVTFTGMKNGRPTFEQSPEDEARNKGLLPKWLIKELDDKRLKVDGDVLKFGGRTIAPGEQVGEPR